MIVLLSYLTFRIAQLAAVPWVVKTAAAGLHLSTIDGIWAYGQPSHIFNLGTVRSQRKRYLSSLGSTGDSGFMEEVSGIRSRSVSEWLSECCFQRTGS